MIALEKLAVTPSRWAVIIVRFEPLISEIRQTYTCNVKWWLGEGDTMRQSARSFFFVLLWLAVSSLFAANAANAAPSMTSPVAGSTLVSSSPCPTSES